MELSDVGQEMSLPKRKRGRPPKIRYAIPSDAEFPASYLTDNSAVKELQLAYKPLKEIMGISKLRPLVEKPNELLYGLYDYYDIIEKPMWFLEITKKYAEKKYNSAVEVIEDVRLVLENCYRFWGKKHKFVKQALRAEKIVAKHIANFPTELKAKCCMALYDSEDALSTEQGSNEQHSYMTDEYTSMILQNLEKKPITTKMGATVEEMQKWEDEVLQGKQHNRQINIIPELAEVGQFLVMAREILCLKPISQYEIERMLLISRESSTLATIMTSFLCPTAMRVALYFKPIMLYDVWANFLQKKLDTWYNTYTKYNNRMQVFLKFGVEPSFFDTVGEVNPLTETPFHELSLHKKASILKALCSNMFHSNKKIEEYFNLVDESSLKSRLLYSDSKYDFVSLFSPEIRVYRSSRVCLDIERTIESVYPTYFNYYPREEEQAQEVLQGSKDSLSRKQKFCLVAHKTESLVEFSKLCAKKRRSRVAINRLLAEEKNRELSLIGLRALYSQWNKSVFKDPASMEISKNYWIAKVVNNPSIVDAETGDIVTETPGKTETVNPTPNRELGKRIMKRKYPIDDQDDSFSSNDDKHNEEDVSDWEDGNIRRSKRIKKVSGLPRFFDHKYMKFDDATEGEYVYGSNYWMNSPEEKAALKKPRKKRAPKETSDSPKERAISKVPKGGKTATKKLLRGNGRVRTARLPKFDNLHLPVIKEEPYTPPIEVPKLSLPPQFVKDSKTPLGQFGPRLGDPLKNDLLSDFSVWDFGLSGFPAFAPLKPVDDACLPEDGDRKLLELGAFKKEEPPIKVESVIKTPPKMESLKPVAPPVKRNRVPFQNLKPVNTPNMMVIPSKQRERPEPQPGPSSILKRVFLPPPDVRGPRLIAGVIPAGPRDMMILKTGLTKVQLPIHHVPHRQSVMIKRKVHLPARPLSIPIVKNQEIPVFENTNWAKHSLSERTVLYIPSGTPTITIPSVSTSSKMKAP